MDFIKILCDHYKDNTLILEELYIFKHAVMVKTNYYGSCGIPENNIQTDIFKYIDFKGKKINTILNILKDSEHPVERSIIIAIINSIMDKSDFPRINAFELIPEEILKSNIITFIGHFPAAERFKNKGYNVNIIELNPKPGDIPWDLSEKTLEKTDIVYITGLTVINNTLPEIISRTENAKYRILLGHSTPLSEKMFDYGLHALGGAHIMNPEKMKEHWLNYGKGIKYAQKDALKTITMTCASF